jgi:GNAT superfamily N-acetyltransferase
MLHRPHPKVDDIMGCSRLVTLPDFQGMGFAMVLIEKVAGAYRAVGKRAHTYPAHPALIRAFDNSPKWRLEKRPGVFSARAGKNSTAKMGGRPCAVFEYCGEAMPRTDGERLLALG